MTRLAPGDPAPPFTLSDADGKQVSLADYAGRKVVVYFYPAASTPGCTKEACDFRDNLAELNDAGLIVRIRPHLRPWLAITLFALVLGPKIARHPGVLRRALRG